MFRDKLLVIGAGPVGLCMAKALKAHGISYDQVDAGDGVGGNWQHGLYDGVHIVSSKRSTGFGDYPMPDDYPDFPSAAQVLAYLQDYARHFGLMEHVELGRKIEKTQHLADESWSVTFADGETRNYKGVVVCNGHHRDKRMPSYPGTFDGPILHTRDYRSPAELEGKRVLVIGCGNSGVDLACEAARVGASSDISMRSGYWFLPKTAFGRPLTDLPIWSLPVAVQRLVLRGIVKVMVGDYRSYGLPRPNHKLFERHPMFGTDLLGLIRQGRVKPRADIARYDGRRVVFKDGSSAEYDLIVAATGYHNSFPFLPPGLVEVRNEAAQIYSYGFPANAKNLYIVGSEQPRNGFGWLLTPAANLFARMIAMQDRIEVPLGAIFEWHGDRLPDTNLLDIGRARRDIWLGGMFLPLLEIQGRRLAAKRARDRKRSGASASNANPGLPAR